MKNKFKSFFLIVFLIVLNSCYEDVHVEKNNIVEKKSVKKMNPALSVVLTDFTKLLNKRSKEMPTIGFMKIIEVKDDISKIYFSSIDEQEQLNEIHIDNYFYFRGVLILVDLNIFKIIDINKSEEFKKIIKKNKFDEKGNYCQYGDYSWLIQIKGDSLEKINKRAHSIFLPKCNNCLEWGGYTAIPVKTHK